MMHLRQDEGQVEVCSSPETFQQKGKREGCQVRRPWPSQSLTEVSTPPYTRAKLKVLPGNSLVFFILGFGFDYGPHQLLSVFNLLSFSAKLAPP